MSDPLEALAQTVMAIQEDPQLRESFIRILEVKEKTQLEKVTQLEKELRAQIAPEEVIQFVHLLRNAALAATVLETLKNN